MKVESQVLNVSQDDAHLVRHLGKAVVLQWGALPKPVQDIILEQAIHVFDEHVTTQLKEQLKAFIGKNKL